ncbi:MAG TPA: alpha/beta hydrolase [Candidatus Acidoferrales bacterium]|nr:alpha/beta hydrolase [Candidatus Acidoferrales bacterium]
MTRVYYERVDVDGLNVFCRLAGPKGRATILLLHGFPSSSHMFRDLIPPLSEQYHVIAPDLPGFGQSDMPPRDQFAYTFDNLANVMTRFTDVLGLKRFVIYIFDYGAPVGLRMALKHPERIAGIVSQNGNAYAEGLTDGWNPIRAYWNDPSPENRIALRSFLKPETTIWQYTQGAPEKGLISPDGYSLDNYYLARPGADEVQLDLFLDYANNVAMYPQFQAYFRKKQPPLLALWGRNDPFFSPEGAEAYRRDLPNAEIRLIDAGHFATETHASAIASAVAGFVSHLPSTASA